MDTTETNMNTDILRIGNSLYAVKRIESEEIDINAELKELYKTKHDTHVHEINEGVVTQAQEDWDKQIHHLRSFNDRGTFTIPVEMYGKPLMVHREKLLELRVITYSPNLVQGTREQFRDCVDDYHTLPEGTLYAKVKPSFSIPMLLGYDSRGGRIYTPQQRTFHSFSGGDVCTGNHSGRDFWRLNDARLEDEMNKVNLFSPASSTISVKAHTYCIRDLYTRENIINITRREDSVWNASALSTTVDNNS